MRLSNLVAGLGAAALLSACAFTTNSFPPSSPSQGTVVSATQTHFSFWYLSPFKNTGELIAKLNAQCPEGRVEGITVTMVNRHWPYAGVHYQYKAVGTCVK